jgi:F0F1-type ATP synthase delta subunit
MKNELPLVVSCVFNSFEIFKYLIKECKCDYKIKNNIIYKLCKKYNNERMLNFIFNAAEFK